MTNEEIVEKIQNGIDVSDNQERLWKQNKKFVSYCIKKYVGGCEQQDYDDFMNEGFIGLLTAAMKFNKEKGTNFLTCAGWYIRSALYKYNGTNTYTVHIPEYLKSRLKKLIEFKRKYRAEFCREPEPKEVQEALCISVHSLFYLEKTLLSMQTRSLDEYIYTEGEESLIDIISSDKQTEELFGRSEYQRQLHEELEKVLNTLDERTALMIRCIYYQNRNYTKTADIVRCTKQAVNTRVKKGFYKIVNSKYREELESFMWEGYKADIKRLEEYVDMEEVEEMSKEFLL